MTRQQFNNNFFRQSFLLPSCRITTHINSKQGDQSWRIFAYWVIVSFGHFENTEIAQMLNCFLKGSKSYISFLTKKKLGCILGDFFQNPSVHPDKGEQMAFCFLPTIKLLILVAMAHFFTSLHCYPASYKLLNCSGFL
jgi:hypothetical protein